MGQNIASEETEFTMSLTTLLSTLKVRHCVNQLVIQEGNMQIKAHHTLTSYVYRRLLTGHRLNQKDFLVKGSWRLAAIVHNIERRRGVKICRAPLKGRAVEYFLSPDEIQRISSKKPQQRLQ